MRRFGKAAAQSWCGIISVCLVGEDVVWLAYIGIVSLLDNPNDKTCGDLAGGPS